MKSQRVLTGIVLAAALALTACGGSGGSASVGSSSVSTNPTAQTAPVMVTVADAPLSNLLSAQVTFSAVSLVPQAGGSPVTVLTQPETIELSGLGTLQEPLELTQIPVGTYSSVNLTISAVTASYIDPSSGQTVTNATATVVNGTFSVALKPALTVSTSSGGDLHLDVLLANSFDLTNGTLTFTPAVSTATAKLETESETDREVEVKGPITAITTTPSDSITVKGIESGKSFTFAVNSSTKFAGSLTLASLQNGDVVRVHGAVQADGSLLATSIQSMGNSQGGSSPDAQSSGGDGIVLATTTDSTGAVTSFKMVLRDGFGDGQAGMPAVVDLSSNTTFQLSEDASKAGLTSFDATQIFPGQSLEVAGTPATNGDIAASEVTLNSNTLRGQLSGTVSGTAPDFSFSLLSSAQSVITVLTKNATLPVTTTAATVYENSLTPTAFAALPTGSNLVIRGFLTQDAQGNYALVAIRIQQPETPEPPENDN